MNVEQESIFEDHVLQIQENLTKRFPDHHKDTIEKSARDWALEQSLIRGIV